MSQTQWAEFVQQILAGATPLIIAFLGFITAIFTAAGLAVVAMIRGNAKEKANYLEMVRENGLELKQLRADLREADKRDRQRDDREQELRDDVAELKDQRRIRDLKIESIQKEFNDYKEQAAKDLKQAHELAAKYEKMLEEAITNQRETHEELLVERKEKGELQVSYDKLKTDRDELFRQVNDLRGRVNELEVYQKTGTGEIDVSKLDLPKG